jgi:hypothetical protein
MFPGFLGAHQIAFVLVVAVQVELTFSDVPPLRSSQRGGLTI